MELFFDNSLAIGYKSHSQIARHLTEDWVERNMASMRNIVESGLSRRKSNWA